MTATISRAELAAGIRAGTLVLVDALPESYYVRQHLPGAVNLVPDEVANRAGALLPDKDTAIVTYCSNPACPNSSQVAAALTRLGYTNVRKFPDGIQGWVEAGLPTETGLATTAAGPTPAPFAAGSDHGEHLRVGDARILV
jgi:rhodanese-related sulfurtransferase